MSKERARLVAPDLYIIATVLVMVVAGAWLVFDASYAKAGDLKSMNYDIWYQVKRQAAFALIGIGCMFAAARVSFARLKWACMPILYGCFGLLALVLILGHTAHGAKSWFTFMGFSLQPSEIAKVGVILYLASALSRPKVFAKNGPARWFTPACVCAAVIGLVVLERDLGTASMLGMLCFAVFFAAGAKKRSLALAGLVCLMMLAGAMAFVPHCRERVTAFLHPWEHRYDEGYQTVHSLSGLGTGGLLGVGLCEGREKFYMPAASTDYIFTTVGEEAGLIGGCILLAGFVIFTYRGLHIAQASASSYGGLLATGVTAMITAQALINIAVVTSSMPATGLPLPFISYGGSALVTVLIAVGILLSASRQIHVSSEVRESHESNSDRRRDGRSRVSRSEYRTSAARSRSTARTAVRR